jgi:hypothetical protein
MGKDKILEQLVAIVAEMQEICAVLRQDAVPDQNQRASPRVRLNRYRLPAFQKYNHRAQFHS